ncbi:hypothetical protein ACOMHN_018700 [Nucella lapillus]
MAEHTTPTLCADEGEQTSSNKLQPTLDDSQKRCSCGIEELTVWRNMLLYRYSAVSHPSFYMETVDYDHDMNELSLSANWITTVPPMLSKTVIRIYYNATKRVTLTLYYAPAQSSGTLLCQGKDCSQWDSSMSIADLTTWLHSRPPCPKVKHLFLHVGLNSCSSGQISVNTWTKLMILCKKVFPSSTLALSSIIPAKGRHNLNNAIAPSNSNLHKACQLLDVAIIDNTSSFVAPSGAPRLALYRDPFHPSVQGTAKLAVSMKKMLANWQPDHFWRSDPGRSDRRNWPQANHHASLLPAQDSAIREQTLENIDQWSTEGGVHIPRTVVCVMSKGIE